MTLLAATLDPKFAWYVSRAAGLMTWALCAASIVWGLMLSSKAVRRRGLPAWLLDLHTFLGTLAVVFAGLHIGGLVADNYTYFSWKEVLVPMGSAWRPGAVSWGVVAFYILLAIQVTSWMRRRLPKRVWHAIHLGSFPLFLMGTLHGILAGSDWTSQVVRWIGAAISLLVMVAIALRLITRAQRAKQAANAPPRVPVRRATSASVVDLAPAAPEAAISGPQDRHTGVGPPTDHMRQADSGPDDLPFASFVTEMVADFDHLADRGSAQRFPLREEPAGGIDGEPPGEFGGALLEELGLISRTAQSQLGPRQ